MRQLYYIPSRRLADFRQLASADTVSRRRTDAERYFVLVQLAGKCPLRPRFFRSSALKFFRASTTSRLRYRRSLERPLQPRLCWLYYTILYYTILYYTVLYYTILYYTILYYTILYYTILYCTVLYCTVRSHEIHFFASTLGISAGRTSRGHDQARAQLCEGYLCRIDHLGRCLWL